MSTIEIPIDTVYKKPNKLQRFWNSLKELWYMRKEKFFVQKSLIQLFPITDKTGISEAHGEVLNNWYYNSVEKTFEQDFKKAHVFSFFAGVIICLVFRKKFKERNIELKSDNQVIEFLLTPVSEMLWIDDITNRKPTDEETEAFKNIE